MSSYEQPDRTERPATVEDVRELMGASTPHFALQIRNRIEKLIAPLPAGDPARVLGEKEMTRLELIAFEGEIRGDAPPGERPLPSLGAAEIS
jgi:hypothetical protein